MTCNSLIEQDLLIAYFDDTLPEDQAEDVEKHLEVCSACQEEVVRLRTLVAGIRSFPRDTEVDIGARTDGMDLDSSEEVVNAPPGSDQKVITDHQIAALRVALALRDFGSADELISGHYDTLHDLDPDQRNAAPLMGLFGRWMDMGHSHIGAGKPTDKSRLEMLTSCLRVFPRPPRAAMSLRDIVYLRMASGYAALAEHRHADATDDFSFVRAVLPELGDKEMGALANFGLAKVYRRNGKYDQVKPFLDAAIRLAEEADRRQMKAGFLIMHAWLLFQKGKIKGAKRELQEAEAILRSGQDHLRLGNIRSAFARIAQREGRYHDARELYGEALAEYREWSSGHPNNARTRVNRAFATRLLCLRHTHHSDGGQVKEELKVWQRQARQDLDEALPIYIVLNDKRGQGNVKAVSALLLMDTGDFKSAERDAGDAYHLGVEQSDRILMARARLVQCMIANEMIEHPSSDTPPMDACRERALSCALEAISTAAQTENPHLRARAHIWHGITLIHFGRIIDAEGCYRKAGGMLARCGGTTTAEEFLRLGNKLRPDLIELGACGAGRRRERKTV